MLRVVHIATSLAETYSARRLCVIVRGRPKVFSASASERPFTPGTHYIYVYAARAFWQAMVAAIIKGLPT